jgi:hypothetical protein
MSDDITFIDGMIFKQPHPKAPDFVKGTLSIKVKEFATFAEQYAKDGWLNIDLKESKQGKYYAALNTFKPTDGQAAKAGMQQVRQVIEEKPQESFADDDIPF